jgi:hypothetical protein
LPKLPSLQQLKNTIRDELRVLPIMQNGGKKIEGFAHKKGKGAEAD